MRKRRIVKLEESRFESFSVFTDTRVGVRVMKKDLFESRRRVFSRRREDPKEITHARSFGLVETSKRFCFGKTGFAEATETDVSFPRTSHPVL